MADSIGKEAVCKPPKPYEDFPLYPHNSKRWAKKIRGRTHFFGPWRADWQKNDLGYQADWQAAYAKYQHEMPYLLQGKTPPPMHSTALTIDRMVNGMLEQKEAEVESKELSKRTWLDYKRTGETLIAELGRHVTVESLQPSDFAALRTKLSKTLGLVALGNEIGRCRVFFNWAYKSELIDRPVRCGVSFKKPSKKAVRTVRNSKPKKLFTLDELRTLYHAADNQMKAFMLLALNGGLGNGDIARLEPRHIVDGWIVFPARRLPLSGGFHCGKRR